MILQMAVEFREVTFPPIRGLNLKAPAGAVVGVIGETGAGKRELLSLAAGLEQPVSGQVLANGSRRFLGPSDAL